MADSDIGCYDDRRAAPHDHQARDDRDADGRQIGERRSARDQDADRHDEGGGAEGRRARWERRSCGGEAAAAKPLRVSTVPRRAAWHADRESDNLFYRKITPLQSGTGAAFTTRVAFLSEQVADATNRFSWQRNSGPKSDVVQVFRHNSLR
jgi:hypothetical protein